MIRTVRAPLLTFAAATAILHACAAGRAPQPSSEAPPIVVSGFEIRNELPYTVTDVMIRVPATGAFAGCGNIQAHSRCTSRVEEVDYRSSEVVISWKERGQPHETEPFRVELPDDPAERGTFAVSVTVFAPGQAGARLVPVTSVLSHP